MIFKRKPAPEVDPVDQAQAIYDAVLNDLDTFVLDLYNAHHLATQAQHGEALFHIEGLISDLRAVTAKRAAYLAQRAASAAA